MTSWQKRLRIGLAIFGIVFGVLVYRSIGERPAATPPRPLDRLDKKALLETTQTVLEQVRGNEREFEIKSGRTLSYEDGSAKHIDVVITRRTEGRVFVITAKEAQAGPRQIDLELSGGVKVSVSDWIVTWGMPFTTVRLFQWTWPEIHKATLPLSSATRRTSAWSG